jgi:hypothetical protein
MTTRFWIRKLFARPPGQRPFRKARFPARPALEALEQRTVPSFTVTNTRDDGSVGSLRWAVGQANMTGGDETIDFDPMVFATPQTITLTGSQLVLTDTTGTETITGPPAGVTVSGGGLSRVFEIVGGVTASMSGLTISGGHTFDFGGGISNIGTLTLTNCTVSGNSCVGYYGNGGGIYNNGALSLTNCTVSGNSSVGYYSSNGGGIKNGGTATLTDCTVSGNFAGLSNGGGTLTLSNTILAANTSGSISGYVNASSSYNLIGTGGSGGLIDGVNHNQVGVANPGLGALGAHGGPTPTIDLLGGSPALNAGDAAQLGLADQRGVVRTGGVNIGAYQASATTFVVSAPGMVQSGVPFDMTVTAIDPFGQVAVGYTGTVTFGTTDTDPGVVLPADHGFVLDDGGMHTFTDTGRGEITLVTPGDQTLTVMDTADNTITGSAVITVNAGSAPHGLGPPPNTLPPRPAQGEAPTDSQRSAGEVVGLEQFFASLHDGDSVSLTVPRLNHQARGDTAPGMADLFGEDLLFP